MDLKDLKFSPQERAAVEGSVTMEPDEYPWGFRLYVKQGELDKLGLSAASLAIGDSVEVQAIGTVDRMTMEADDGGEDNRIEIQLKRVAVARTHDEQALAEKIYK